MTVYTLSIKRIFARFFPKKYITSKEDLPHPASAERKKELAEVYLAQGELALLQGNLKALSLFEKASELDPSNPAIWYRQGLAFFEYGSEDGKEKSLLLSAKYFKFATQKDPCFFAAYVAWGNALLQLGRFYDEHHFLIEAKDKYQKAISLPNQQSEENLAELYWDYGIVYLEIARHSGEALDLRCCIDAFQKYFSYVSNPPSEFLHDLGTAYMEMGFLINNIRFHFQAVYWFMQAVKASSQYFDAWASLGEGLSQLYIQTMDPRFGSKASEAYAAALKICPGHSDTWLSWAQILSEIGKANQDPKQLRLSIEKCARAAALEEENPGILSQWVESLALLGSMTSRLDLLIEAESKVLKATELFPDHPDLWLAYGICLKAFGEYYEDFEYYDLAIEKLQWGLSMDRTSAEHWHLLGLLHTDYAVLSEDEELFRRAHRFFLKALDLKPGCPTLLFDTAVSFFKYSELTQDLCSLEQSIELFESLLQTHKEAIFSQPKWVFEYACAIAWLGQFSMEETHPKKALETLSYILLFHPDYPKIHLKMALCYTELGHLSSDPNYYQKAIYSFRLSMREDSENEELWLEWGLCLIHLAHHTIEEDEMNGLYIEAEEKLIRAGRLGNSDAYYNLACLYSILNRHQEGMEFMYKALEARTLPSLDEMVEDEWLDNLRNTPSFVRFFTALEEKMTQTRED